MMKISLVIPAYNEEKRLGPFLESIARWLPRHRRQIQEILIIDDGSTDHTQKVANKYLPRLGNARLVTHTVNQGKGAAVQTGVNAAKGDAIVFMDSDGATAITEMPKMIQALQTADIAVGNRWMSGAQTERHSHLRQFSGWLYRTYMGLFGLRGIDTMCGFKGYRKLVARDLFKDLIEPRWLFDTEVAYKAVQRKYRIVNFPIRWESKDGSKLSTKTLIASAFKIFPLIRRLKRQGKTNPR